jgi:two-component system CheB/CheR fusion protein
VLHGPVRHATVTSGRVCSTETGGTPYVLTVTAQLGGIAILLVDDDADTLAVLRELVADEGADGRTAMSAHEALEVLRTWKPDVMLLDIEMPVMDGYALLLAIRSQSELHKVPAVAITGLSDPSDKDRAFASGFDAHMTKPFDGAALIDLVEWLASRPRRATSRRTSG